MPADRNPKRALIEVIKVHSGATSNANTFEVIVKTLLHPGAAWMLRGVHVVRGSYSNDVKPKVAELRRLLQADGWRVEVIT